MSLPIGDGALVTGKFLAGLVMFAFVLALAAVFPATVHYLGEPDGRRDGRGLARGLPAARGLPCRRPRRGRADRGRDGGVRGRGVRPVRAGHGRHRRRGAPSRRVAARVGSGRGGLARPPALDRGARERQAGSGFARVLRAHRGPRARDHPCPRRRAPQRVPDARGRAARRRRVRGARRRPRRGYRSRRALGRFRRHQRGARAHPRFGNPHDPRRAAGRGRRDAVLERGAGRHPRSHPHPRAPGPGHARCLRACERREARRAPAGPASRFGDGDRGAGSGGAPGPDDERRCLLPRRGAAPRHPRPAGPVSRPGPRPPPRVRHRLCPGHAGARAHAARRGAQPSGRAERGGDGARRAFVPRRAAARRSISRWCPTSRTRCRTASTCSSSSTPRC